MTSPRRTHDWMLGRVATRAGRAAVVSDRGAWSYAELAQAARAYAGALERAGLGPGDRIAAPLDMSFEAIALFAACSMIQATIVPIDAHAPEDRLHDLLRDIDPRAIVLGPGAPAASLGGEREVAELHASGLALALVRPGARRPAPSDPRVAYVIFTSGSTGRPKGIMMSHRAVVDFWDGLAEQARLHEDERLASSSPFHFDFSLLDMGLCLGAGATLVLPRRALVRKPGLLVDELAAREVTVFSGVPTLWRLMLAFGKRELAGWRSLRRVLFAGEHFPRAQIEELYALFPDLEIFNIYGQSESIACSFATLPRPLPRAPDQLPVGRGHKHAEIFLWSEAGEVTRPHAVGELHLKGSILFDGYFRNPHETARRLVPDPRPGREGPVFRSGDLCFRDEAGVLHFIGRADNQVKVQGNRVEVEEIEAVLQRHAAVKGACVVPHPASGQIELHAFVSSDDATLASELRELLSARLPPYMCPRHIHLVTALPMTPNGKIDRAALRARLEALDAPAPAPAPAPAGAGA